MTKGSGKGDPVLGNKEERDSRLTARRSGSITSRTGQLHCTNHVGSSSPRACGIETNKCDVSGRCFGDRTGPQALVTNRVRDSGSSCHTSTHVDLALDLLAGPAGSLNCALTVLSGCASLSHERGDPVVAEVGSELAVGEGVSKITSE